LEFVNGNQYDNLKGIYKITNLINNKIYIGKTEDRFIERFWQHIWSLDKKIHYNKHLENAWQKYGSDNFRFEVVHIQNENEDINELEKKYIVKYDTFENGYNKTYGGEGQIGHKMRETTKRLIGEKNKINGLGRKASDETKKKMRMSSKHTSPTEQHKEILRTYRTGIKVSDNTKEKLRNYWLGSKSNFAVIDEETAKEIKIQLIGGKKHREIASELSVSHKIIASISANNSWKHVYVDGWAEYCKVKHHAAPNKLLSDDNVRIIRTLLTSSANCHEIAHQFNVNPSVIYDIKNNKTYRDIK